MNQENVFWNLFEAQSTASNRLRTSSAKDRCQRLNALEAALKEYERDIADALHIDFGKPFEEVLITEITPVLLEIRHAKRQLRKWMKPKRVGRPLALFGTTSQVQCEGKGPSLIISPWNYVITLTLGPIVSAVSAGCPVMVKPSERTPNASQVLAQLLASVFPADEVAVCMGDADVAESLLELPFRHIHFTGSPAIGRKVMAAASRHLASVTLELGGKTPAIVHASADITATARRIVFGKFANAGQTCIAPDYLVVDRQIMSPLVAELKETLANFYGESLPIQTPKDLSRIVSEGHTTRLAELLDEARQMGANVVSGGSFSAEEAYFEPTLVVDVPAEARLMKEEIFGPILPIQPFSESADLFRMLEDHSPPLSTYVFARDGRFVKEVIRRVETGAIVVNETLLHFANPHLPFGGLSTSGIGRAHGYAGFLSFSNEKGVLSQHGSPWLIGRLYPPYGSRTRKWIRALMRLS